MEQEETQELDNRVLRVPVLLPGDRCRVELTGQSEVPTGDGDQAKKPVEGKAKTGLAQVKFVGQVPGMPKGYWVGVQYDDRIGKNDGMLNGRRYFRCPAGYGGFVRSTKLTKIEPQASAGKEAVASEVSPGSMASRIAKRRQERSMSGRSMGQLTLDEWHARVAPTREEGQATPDMTCATGPELDKAVVGTLSQFTILARNSSSEQVPKGGDIIEVTMRGLGASLSPASLSSPSRCLPPAVLSRLLPCVSSGRVSSIVISLPLPSPPPPQLCRWCSEVAAGSDAQQDH